MIPKKIKYVYGDIPTAIDMSSKKINVYSACIVDADNPNTLKTAIHNSTKYISYNYSSTFNNPIVKSNPVIEETDNIPITNVKIIGKSFTNVGSFIYQALVDDKYLIDLCSNVLLEASINIGINKGKLKGEYIWAVRNSKMTLIRIGSEAYNMLVEFTQLKLLPILKHSELEVGTVYKNRKGQEAIFLGRINSVSYERLQGGWELRNYNVNDNLLCFVKNIYNKNLPNVEDQLKDFKNCSYGVTLSKKSDFVKAYYKVEPFDNYMEQIKEFYTSSLKQSILEHSKGKLSKNSMYDSIDYYSKYVNMVESSEKVKVLFDYKKYLVLI